jgi:hypothetical protein
MADFLRSGMEDLDQARKDADAVAKAAADAVLLAAADAAAEAKKVAANVILLQQAADAAAAAAVADAATAASTPVHNKVGVFENNGTSTVSGTTVTVNLNTGNFFEMDLQGLSGNVTTFTISNATQENNMVSCFIVKIIQGTSTTTRNFTWASIVSNGTNIDWSGGAGPDITTGNDKVDILSFTTYDKGTTWYGAPVGQEFY